jgi:hypothetical protein
MHLMYLIYPIYVSNVSKIASFKYLTNICDFEPITSEHVDQIGSGLLHLIPGWASN